MLPHVCLSHGFSSTVHKLFAFMWSVWLSFGPGQERLERFFSSVVSVTTDWGIEAEVINSVDVLPHFMRKLRSDFLPTAFGDVRSVGLLFPRAIWIPGWNHLFANFMLFSLGVSPRWPMVLKQMRALVGFWKVADNRLVLSKHLRSAGLHKEASMLKSFSGSFAKWRFETIATVFAALLAIKDILRAHFQKALYGNVQQPGELDEVARCIADCRLWAFMVALAPFVRCLDDARQWGLGCSCHPQSTRSAPIPCAWKSRRLPEAADRIECLRRSLLRLAQNMTFDDCEQDQEAMCDAMLVCRRASAGLGDKFGWVSKIPWRLAALTSPIEARICLEQFNSQPPDCHHPVSLRVFSDPRLRADIERLAAVPAGADFELSPKLRELHDELKVVPLTEMPAEGVHRSLNDATRKSNGAGLTWKFSTHRLKQNISQATKLVRTPAGRHFFRRPWTSASPCCR